MTQMRAATSSKTKKAAAPPPIPPTMSIGAFARHKDVTEATVRKWREKGLVIEVSRGRINVAASDQALESRSPIGAKAAVPTSGVNGSGEQHPGGGYSTAEAARRRANIQLQEAELEFALKAGELCRMSEVIDAVGEQLAIVRARLLAIPSSVAPKLSAKLDTRVVEAILADAIGHALSDLCDGSREAVEAMTQKGIKR